MSEQFDWTEEKDLLLAGVTLQHIQNGESVISAFGEAGEKLNVSAAECGYRWNSYVRHQHIGAIKLANKIRNFRNKGECVDEKRYYGRH